MMNKTPFLLAYKNNDITLLGESLPYGCFDRTEEISESDVLAFLDKNDDVYLTPYAAERIESLKQ